MYSRVIVPLDGTNLAEHILPYVRALAGGLKLPVDIVRVVEPVEYAATDPDSYPKWDSEFESMLTNVSTGAGEYVNEVATALKDHVPEVNQVFDTQDPVEHIVSQANRYPDALIAIATRGQAGIRKLITGSTTEKVMQSVSNPMLVVRPKEPQSEVGQDKIGNIIVPLDGSDVAEHSLPGAIGLAKTLGLGVTLLRIASVGIESVSFGEYPAIVHEDLTQSFREDALAYLAFVGERLNKEGLENVEKVAGMGHVPTVITEVAQKRDNPIIAMTTHARTGLAGWIMGSMASRVVRGSGIPVLLTRVVEDAPAG